MIVSKSAVKIDYEVRPCKFVERRMLIASISRILGAIRKGRNYQYVGFGGCAFTDFKLFHRELQIDDMISIENGSYSDEKLELNKPFQRIKIFRGDSTTVLPTIDLSVPSVIWLDYDNVLQKYMFEDLEVILHTIPPGSVLIVSCNRELKKGNYQELEINKDDRNIPMSPEDMRIVFGDLLPFDIGADACAPANTNDTIKSMLDKKIHTIVSDRNLSKGENIKFHLLYNIMYNEIRVAKMYTYGGIVCDENLSLEHICLDNFDFIYNPDDPSVYKIDVPVLTHRETLMLNQILFDEIKEKEIIDKGIIKEIDLREYKKIYKYCPFFHDVRL